MVCLMCPVGWRRCPHGPKWTVAARLGHAAQDNLPYVHVLTPTNRRLPNQRCRVHMQRDTDHMGLPTKRVGPNSTSQKQKCVFVDKRSDSP
jgi:hypothetical protein